MNNIVPVDEPICADAVVHQPHARFLLLLHPAMSQILGRVVDMLAAGLRELSCTVEITNALPTGLDYKVIVLGANFFDESELSNLPPGSIILNVENSSSSFVNVSYMRLLRKFIVWDYDRTNADTIASILVRPVHYLRMFYAAELTRILNAETKDIDVLFYGSFNARRSAVLDDLRQRGLGQSCVKRSTGVKRRAYPLTPLSVAAIPTTPGCSISTSRPGGIQILWRTSLIQTFSPRTFPHVVLGEYD